MLLYFTIISFVEETELSYFDIVMHYVQLYSTFLLLFLTMYSMSANPVLFEAYILDNCIRCVICSMKVKSQGLYFTFINFH